MKLTPLQALGLILLLTLVVYSHSISSNGFIWDDNDYVTRNWNVQSPDGLLRIWTQPSTSPQYYPVAFTALWMEHKIFGLNPVGFHTVNVLLHAASACLLYLLLRRMQSPVALVAACLFAVHPINVESAAWVSEQKNLLSLLFGLLAIWHYLTFTDSQEATSTPALTPAPTPPDAPAPAASDAPTPPTPDAPAPAVADAPAPAVVNTVATTPAPNWNAYGWAFLFFLLALFSKTVVAVLPVVLLLLLFWKRGKLSWRDLEPTIPMFIVGATVGLFTAYWEQVHVGAMGDVFNLTKAEHILVAGRAVWFYLGSVLWPSRLIFIYPRWQLHPDNLLSWFWPAAAIAALAFAWLGQKTFGRGLFVIAALFVVILFPALGFFNVYPMRFSFVADHFAYHATLPLLTGIAWLLWYFGGKLKLSSDIQLTAVGIILAGLALVSFNQTHVFDDSASLWADTISQSKASGAEPSWIAYDNFGAVLKDQGHPDQALEMFKEAYRVGNKDISINNIAGAYIDMQKFDDARKTLAPLMTAAPNFYLAYNNYGVALLNTGEPAKALEYLKGSWKYMGPNPATAISMGRSYALLKDYPHAEEMFKQTAQARPDLYQPHIDLYQLYMAWGKTAEARQEAAIMEQFLAARGESVLPVNATTPSSQPDTQPAGQAGPILPGFPTTSPSTAPVGGPAAF